MARALRQMTICLAVLTAGGCAVHQEAPSGALALAGRVSGPRLWTAAQIRADFAGDLKTIQYTLKGANHTALAVPLVALVDAAKPKFDPKIKNDPLRFVVVVEGADGYMATFALDELLPAGGNREAWVAVERDGQPLPDREAPASLIVPGDQKPGRWVHGIKRIWVGDAGHFARD